MSLSDRERAEGFRGRSSSCRTVFEPILSSYTESIPTTLTTPPPMTMGTQ
jgi:hypothetical protein